MNTTMRKKEASITPKVMKWFAAVAPHSAPVEIKHTRGKKSFNKKELKEHQINWLLACTTERGCTYKLPDTGYGANPFDVLHYKKANSYIVIVYPTIVCAIEIQALLREQGASIDEATAERICSFKVKLQDL